MKGKKCGWEVIVFVGFHVMTYEKSLMFAAAPLVFCFLFSRVVFFCYCGVVAHISCLSSPQWGRYLHMKRRLALTASWYSHLMQYNRNENTFIHFTCNATRRSCLVCVSGLRQKEFPYSIFHFRRRRPAAVCSGWHAVAARALPQLNPKRILYFFIRCFCFIFLSPCERVPALTVLSSSHIVYTF